MKVEVERNEMLFSLLFISGSVAWVTFLNCILGIFPAGLIGTGEKGEKFYFLPYLKQQLGGDVSQHFWTDAGFLSTQDYLLLFISLISFGIAFRMIWSDRFSELKDDNSVANFIESLRKLPMPIMVSLLLILVPLLGLLQGIITGEEPKTFYQTQQLGIEEDEYIIVHIPEYDEFKWTVRYFGGEHEIDIIFLDEYNCGRFEDKPVVYIGELSRLSFSGSSASEGPVELDEGSYCLVIDNSDRGASSPPSAWGVDYTIFVEYSVWAN